MYRHFRQAELDSSLIARVAHNDNTVLVDYDGLPEAELVGVRAWKRSLGWGRHNREPTKAAGMTVAL